MDSENNLVGERIKIARLAASIGQKKLAELVGRTQSAVSQWERGDAQPSLDAVPSIANVLSVSCDWLLGKEEALMDNPRNTLRSISAMALVGKLSAALDSGKLKDRQMLLISDLLDQLC